MERAPVAGLDAVLEGLIAAFEPGGEADILEQLLARHRDQAERLLGTAVLERAPVVDGNADWGLVQFRGMFTRARALGMTEAGLEAESDVPPDVLALMDRGAVEAASIPPGCVARLARALAVPVEVLAAHLAGMWSAVPAEGRVTCTFAAALAGSRDARDEQRARWAAIGG